MGKVRILCLLAMAALPVPVSADLITFDEPSLGAPVNGMVIGNVSFGFSPALDATIVAGTPLTLLVQGRSIGGVLGGTLTLDFTVPVSSVGYRFALNATALVAQGSTMELFDVGGESLGVFSGSAAPVLALSEGSNSGSSSTPVGSASITFADGFNFQFDNLSTTAVVPVPSAFLLGGFGLGMVGWARRKLS